MNLHIFHRQAFVFDIVSFKLSGSLEEMLGFVFHYADIHVLGLTFHFVENHVVFYFIGSNYVYFVFAFSIPP